MQSGDASPLVRVRCTLTLDTNEAVEARDLALLDGVERERLRRIRAAGDRRDYVAAHALLRRTLTAAVPATAPEEWRFESTDRGKPHLPAALAGDPPLCFSLSHTGGVVVCAVSRGPELGVDAERAWRSGDVRLLLPDVCSVAEQAHVTAAPPSARAARFLDLWTLKEAYLKARGTGITAALPEISFDLRAPGAITASLPERTPRDWWLALIRPSEDSRIALAVATATTAPPLLDAAMVAADGRSTRLVPVRRSRER